MAKQPIALHLWVDDYLSCPFVDALSPDMELAYLRLLMRQRQLGAEGLPDDRRCITAWAKLRSGRYPSLCDTVLNVKFPACADGRRRNPKLHAQILREEWISNEARDSGKRGAASRWGNGAPNENPDDSSSSSSSDSKEDEDASHPLATDGAGGGGGKQPKRQRSVDQEEWSLWARMWNDAAATKGAKSVAREPNTALATDARKKIYTYEPNESKRHKLRDAVCQELRRTAPFFVEKSWFTFWWLWQKGCRNLEKFLEGSYRTRDEEDRVAPSAKERSNIRGELVTAIAGTSDPELKERLRAALRQVETGQIPPGLLKATTPEAILVAVNRNVVKEIPHAVD